MVSFCAPRGWTGLKTADFTELVAAAKATGLPVMLCGDNDDVGRKAMRRVRERLRDEGLNPIDTGGLAPSKGSIADLGADDLDTLIRLQVMELDPRWQKPVRNRKQYQEFKCLRPKRWQGGGWRRTDDYKPPPVREYKRLRTMQHQGCSGHQRRRLLGGRTRIRKQAGLPLKLKPKWNTHLLGVENQAGSCAGGLDPLISGWFGNAASLLPSGRPVQRGNG